MYMQHWKRFWLFTFSSKVFIYFYFGYSKRKTKFITIVNIVYYLSSEHLVVVGGGVANVLSADIRISSSYIHHSVRRWGSPSRAADRDNNNYIH
jgi:hypothetical protein